MNRRKRQARASRDGGNDVDKLRGNRPGPLGRSVQILGNDPEVTCPGPNSNVRPLYLSLLMAYAGSGTACGAFLPPSAP
jgi:hypothetical protein